MQIFAINRASADASARYLSKVRLYCISTTVKSLSNTAKSLNFECWIFFCVSNLQVLTIANCRHAIITIAPQPHMDTFATARLSSLSQKATRSLLFNHFPTCGSATTTAP